MQIPDTVSLQAIPVRWWGFFENKKIHEPHYKEKICITIACYEAFRKKHGMREKSLISESVPKWMGAKLKTMRLI
jgi:hypothetical protein